MTKSNEDGAILTELMEAKAALRGHLNLSASHYIDQAISLITKEAPSPLGPVCEELHRAASILSGWTGIAMELSEELGADVIKVTGIVRECHERLEEANEAPRSKGDSSVEE